MYKSVFQPIEIRVFLHQQHMHFVGTHSLKKKVIQSTSATESAPTVTRSLVPLRYSFDLELTYFT